MPPHRKRLRIPAEKRKAEEEKSIGWRVTAYLALREKPHKREERDHSPLDSVGDLPLVDSSGLFLLQLSSCELQCSR